MTVEEKVQAILVGDATLIASVPAARIKTPGQHQNLTLPYIVHFPVGVEPTYTHGGLAALRIWSYYQVSIFSDDYPTGRAIADLVRDLLGNTRSPISCFWQSLRTYSVDNTETQQFIMEFRIAEAL